MNVRAVVKEIAQAPALLNVQVLADKHVQVAVAKDADVVVWIYVHLIANLNVKVLVALVVQVAHIHVLEHVRAYAEMPAVAVAMAQLVYSNGEY